MTVVVPIQRSKAAADARAVRVGVLLVNLGTPDSADARGVRVYLKEFLSDPRVIEDQGLKWKLVLNGVILRIRPGRKARDYQKIWNREKNESPLKTITRAQSEKLADAISDHDHDFSGFARCTILVKIMAGSIRCTDTVSREEP